MRFSSLLMLMELAAKLKENYVVLLPETIPFLAELMEGQYKLQIIPQMHDECKSMNY